MRISGKKGILSLLLSLVLVLELILSSGQIVLASSENHQDVYTVKILNEQGESVPGVKVVYDLYTDATGSDKKQETVDASVRHNKQMVRHIIKLWKPVVRGMTVIMIPKCRR